MLTELSNKFDRIPNRQWKFLMYQGEISLNLTAACDSLRPWHLDLSPDITQCNESAVCRGIDHAQCPDIKYFEIVRPLRNSQEALVLAVRAMSQVACCYP